MRSEVRKLHVIEEVLKVKSEKVLTALEDLLKKSEKNKNGKKVPGIRNFSGIWSKNEADEIEKIIEESCEIIHPDDWK
ncbi:hypothetical protein [Daejeonella sp. JGW-45]|uniref:hypothetical protein n=1 Tax=Daejeonella sp. JGW-45 TaxID=3034148 RepID=UPI0023EC1945|nr:hypothetical protein [Daejeonella sp. JGW-45]